MCQTEAGVSNALQLCRVGYYFIFTILVLIVTEWKVSYTD